MKYRKGLIIGAVLGIFIVVPISLLVAWLDARPAWLLSARNSPEGVIVEVYKENQTQPTYRTVLAGRAIPTDLERIHRTELPPDVGTTTFYDDTLKPGRWTLVLDGVEVDIMERALIIDDNQELLPIKR